MNIIPCKKCRFYGVLGALRPLYAVFAAAVIVACGKAGDTPDVKEKESGVALSELRIVYTGDAEGQPLASFDFAAQRLQAGRVAALEGKASIAVFAAAERKAANIDIRWTSGDTKGSINKDGQAELGGIPLPAALSVTAITVDVVLGTEKASFTLTVTPPKTPDGAYVITMGPKAQGNLSAAPNPAKEGETVTLTAKKDAGYVQKLSADSEEVSFTKRNEETYTFVMPALDVRIDAEFVPAASSNAKLATLTLSPGTLSPVFSEDTLAYELELSHSVSEVLCDYAPSHIAAKAEGPSGAAAFSPADETGRITITVTAQSGAQSAYTVTLVRLPDPSLQSAKVGAADTVPVLSETIAPNIGYESSPPKDYAITLTPAASASGITVTVEDGGKFGFSGGLAGTVNLAQGDTKEGPVTVTAEKTVAGKPRKAAQSYQLVLFRPGDPLYPRTAMAEGGTVRYISTGGSGQYDEVHLFTYDPGHNTGGQTVSAFTPKAGVSITGASVLVVAGGGAGGYHNASEFYRAGGGGAGGLSYQSGLSFTAKDYIVKTGAGGASGKVDAGTGIAGKDSQFDAIIMKGGGGGASSRGWSDTGPSSGGSGGGGGRAFAGAPPYDPQYGFKGGDGAGFGNVLGAGSAQGYGGGGGGAGGAGEKGGSGDHGASQGKGGIGKTWAAIGDIVTPQLIGVPDTVLGIAGGGAGNYKGPGAAANGAGYGGGRLGYTGTYFSGHGIPLYDESADALHNTGGGGGANFTIATTTFRSNGAGGSGLVVVRFPYTAPAATP